jgi:hypothetical protein
MRLRAAAFGAADTGSSPVGRIAACDTAVDDIAHDDVAKMAQPFDGIVSDDIATDGAHRTGVQRACASSIFLV